MAVTTDIRLDRIRHEYTGLRDTQDALMDRIDSYEAALLGLTDSRTHVGTVSLSPKHWLDDC